MEPPHPGRETGQSAWTDSLPGEEDMGRSEAKCTHNKVEEVEGREIGR